MDYNWKKFHENGLLVETLGFQEKVESFRRQMLSVFDIAANFYGVGPIKSDTDLINLYRGDYNFVWKQAHKMLQVLPMQNSFASDTKLLELLSKINLKWKI